MLLGNAADRSPGTSHHLDSRFYYANAFALESSSTSMMGKACPGLGRLEVTDVDASSLHPGRRCHCCAPSGNVMLRVTPIFIDNEALEHALFR